MATRMRPSMPPCRPEEKPSLGTRHDLPYRREDAADAHLQFTKAGGTSADLLAASTASSC